MNDPKLRYIALGGALAVLFLLVCGGLYLAIIGRDVDASLAPVLGFATPTIAILLASVGIVKGQEQNNQELQEIKSNVNGRLSQLIDNHKALVDENAELKSEIQRGKHAQPDEDGVTQ